MVMRLILGALLALTLLLTGCGDDAGSGDEADDPAPTQSSPPAESDPAEGPVDFTEVAMVTESNVGGEGSTQAAVLDSEEAVDEFAAQFEGTRMRDRLADEVAAADVPDGQTLVGSVVAVGCDVPAEIFVEATPSGVKITPGKMPPPGDKQCLVAMTTVALVTVDSAVV